MKKFYLLLAVLCVTTFTMARTVILNVSDYSATSITDKGLAIVSDKGSGYTNPAYNTTSFDLRIYSKGTLTISTTDTAHITSIVFNLSYQGQQQLATLTATNGTMVQDVAEASWSGHTKSVTFTVGTKADFGTKPKDTGQLCFLSLTVATTGEGADEDDCTLDLTQEFDIVKGHALYYPQSGSYLKSFYVQVYSDFDMEYETSTNDWIIVGGTGAFYTFDIYPTTEKSFVGTYTSTIGDNKVGGLGIKNQSSLIIHKCDNDVQSFLKSGSVQIVWARDNLYTVTYDVTDEATNRHVHTWTEIPINAYDEFGKPYAIVNEQTAIDMVESSLGVYVRNGQIIVPTEVGQKVAVYNVMGQKVYATSAESIETHIVGLPTNQVLLVRSGRKVAKVIL
ncbi:MAG TPA: hypothetical protein VJ856_03065 [Paludibacteraceae bacterium]|nr:hypothetical protein [Paludibacteraceae bacterium]